MIEYTNSQVRDMIDEYIHSARDRCILKDKLIDGIHYEPLAEKYDMSVSQVKRIVKVGASSIFSKMD